MDILGQLPAPKSNQHFKINDAQTREVHEFLRAHCQGLQSGDKPTINTLFSAVQTEYPELRLARSTFTSKFGIVLESHKKDAGVLIRSEL